MPTTLTTIQGRGGTAVIQKWISENNTGKEKGGSHFRLKMMKSTQAIEIARNTKGANINSAHPAPAPPPTGDAVALLHSNIPRPERMQRENDTTAPPAARISAGRISLSGGCAAAAGFSAGGSALYP
jgi:hypothetical protein